MWKLPTHFGEEPIKNAKLKMQNDGRTKDKDRLLLWFSILQFSFFIRLVAMGETSVKGCFA